LTVQLLEYIKEIFKMKYKNKILILIIFIIAFSLRIYGFNWDQGNHLHPDERFLTMVLTSIEIPSSFSQYLNPQISTLNPYNNNYSFFVYGAFPLNLVKITGQFLNQTTYEQFPFVGRSLTILADLLVVLLIFLISQKILNLKNALLASFFYAICVLPIQLAHFYTVDPFLNLFIVLSFYFLISIRQNSRILFKIFLLSLSFSIALACKISAIYFLPVIIVFAFFTFFKNPKLLFYYSLFFLFLTAIFFRFNQPQAFSTGNFLNWTINPQFISNLKELQGYNNIDYYPPGIQWLKTTPLVFPLKNIIFWGAGLPLGIIFVLSIFYSIYYLFKKSIKKNFLLFITLFWILFLFFYQGTQHVTTMRYFLPIYPFLCITSAFFICQIYKNKIFNFKFIQLSFFIILLIYPCCFISIYFKDHTRVAASKWIYQNISIGSTLATEYWDDSLPLSISRNSLYDYQYQSLAVATYDSREKISKLKDQLKTANYIILSSNRFYVPITKNADKYPLTTKYYQTLFNGSLGFKLVAEFHSYPVFNDSSAEEAYTVYDHPQVFIFQKTSAFNIDSF